MSPGPTTFTFKPVPSAAGLFAATPDHKYIFIIGPVGSTKTTTCLMFLLMKAAQQTPSPDGKRRTRFAIIRNTLTAIKSTVLRDIQSLFGPLAQYRPSENIVRFQTGDIDSEWFLLSLEEPEDQRRLLSLQLSAVYVNEAREVKWDLIMAAFSRTGRYPSMMHGGVACSHRFLLADSNLGVEGSPMYQFLEEEQPPELLYIRQPSALSDQADWLQFLPEGYYADAMVGASKAWIKQHVEAEWGWDLSGEPVFAQQFDPDWHIAEKTVKVLPDAPLLLGIDPGLNPAVLVGQLTPSGQLTVLAERYAANALFRPFLTDTVIPLLQSTRFVHRPVHAVMDPAGVSRTAMARDTPFGVLRELSLDVTTARTNDVQPRIRAIERLLVETRAGSNPALLIDPGCQVLIDALSAKYRYKRKPSTGELEPVPEKKHPTSDVTDCLGYMALGLSGNVVKRRMERAGYQGRERNRRPTPSPLGWT